VLVLLAKVHLGSHWTCAVVDFQRQSIFYYDSMTVRRHAVPLLAQWTHFVLLCHGGDN
jgi:Ulp1 family protease